MILQSKRLFIEFLLSLKYNILNGPNKLIKFKFQLFPVKII